MLPQVEVGPLQYWECLPWAPNLGIQIITEKKKGEQAYLAAMSLRVFIKEVSNHQKESLSSEG